MSRTRPPHVAVIGGGISGLAAAHRLRTGLGTDARITLVEQSDRLGGVLRTIELAGVPMDVGAEAFLARRPEVPALLRELALTESLVHPAQVSASVRAAGRTTGLPARTMLGIPGTGTRLDGLLSTEGLDRVASEAARPLRWSPGEDVALGGLLRDRFGDELTERLVDPLLGGVYAGRVDRLGLRATIPTLAAALDTGVASLTAAADQLLPPPPTGSSPVGPPVFGAIRGGYRVLAEALLKAADPEVRLGLPVRELTATAAGWRLGIGSASSSGPRSEAVDVDAVLLAVPAPALRKLLAEASPEGSRAAGEVELASPVVVAMAFRAKDAATLPMTSGVLVAADEPLGVKAFTHSARKWPHLAPEATDGLIRLRASLGRAGDAETLRVPDDELVRRAMADLATLAGITAAPVEVHVQRWGGGLPQYGVGHGRLVEELEQAVALRPGLAVAGAILHGVGVPACIGTGRSAADRLVAFLSSQQTGLQTLVGGNNHS